VVNDSQLVVRLFESIKERAGAVGAAVVHDHETSDWVESGKLFGDLLDAPLGPSEFVEHRNDDR
jgi:hypothetical protein